MFVRPMAPTRALGRADWPVFTIFRARLQAKNAVFRKFLSVRRGAAARGAGRGRYFRAALRAFAAGFFAGAASGISSSVQVPTHFDGPRVIHEPRV